MEDPTVSATLIHLNERIDSLQQQIAVLQSNNKYHGNNDQAKVEVLKQIIFGIAKNTVESIKEQS